MVKEADKESSFFSLKVSNVMRETADASSIAFQIDPKFKQKFHYQAGQFMTFQIPWQDFFIQRSYSLSSSPSTGEPHTITVKRVDNGRGSNWFNDAVKPGMEISASPPSGRFTLNPGHENQIILFAGGSGITPILSIIKSILAQSTEHSRKLTLIYANRDQDSIIFHDTLQVFSENNSSLFTCHYHLDSEDGYIDSKKITRLIKDNWEADFYLCGPGPFMDMVEETLLAHDVPRSRLFIERFISPVDPDQNDPQKIEEVCSPNLDEVKLTVTVDGIDFDVPYQAGKTLLECVLDAPNIDQVPHSCQQGHCGACMSILKEGEVTMRENHVLSKRDLESGYVLACQSIPQSGSVWIDFDE